MLTESVKIESRFNIVEITDNVKKAVEESGVNEGLCLVYTPSTTASILITSFYDPKGHEDILDDLERLFPGRDNFHYSGSTQKGAAHSKSAVVGTSRELIVKDGEVCLGHSEGIFLAEFDGPGESEYRIKVLG